MRILYFAPIDWGYIRQRPQHLAQRLSSSFDFCYVQPLGLRNLRVGDIGRIVRRLFGLFRREVRHGRLTIKSLLYVPVMNRWIRKVNVLLLKKQLRTLATRDTVIWITTPADVIPDIAGWFDYKALVYEMMDDYAAFHRSRESAIKATEEWLICRADTVIATSSSLSDKARRVRNDAPVVLVGNGVDYDFFAGGQVSKPPELAGMNKVIGYIGSVDAWMDLEIIAFLADARKDLDFVFVGPLKIGGLPARNNIHYLGSRDYSSIPRYCGSFDVCLIPFKKGEFADTINPVKLYEYFALGKPVVASTMKELTPFKNYLYMAESKRDFLDKLEQALAEKDDRMTQKRKELARRNDWSAKADMIRDVLMKMP